MNDERESADGQLGRWLSVGKSTGSNLEYPEPYLYPACQKTHTCCVGVGFPTGTPLETHICTCAGLPMDMSRQEAYASECMYTRRQ